MQIALAPDESAESAAERANALKEVGCDKVIFTMRGKFKASLVEQVAVALAPLC